MSMTDENNLQELKEAAYKYAAADKRTPTVSATSD